MPYKIIDVDNGFKVMLKGSRPPRYYSKNALTKKMATRQMRALYRSENQKGGCLKKDEKMKSLFRVASQMFI
jgi:hypothetical protein